MPASYTVNCSILFSELPIWDRPQAARDAGFTAVEFWWPFESPTPSPSEVARFVTAIKQADVQLTGLNFAAGDMPAGDRGILSDPTMIRTFRRNVDIAVGIAEELGTRAFNALYGNRIDDFSPVEQDDTAAGNLAFAAEAAERIGAVVLIEPVSGAPRYPLLTAADAIAVIDRLGDEFDLTNVRLLADLYHLHVNGDDVSAVIRAHGSRIGHVQIADAPGRGEPGTGRIPLQSYLDQLEDQNYRGFIGLEYKPSRVDTFGWLPREERSSLFADAPSTETRTS
jgi:hydroxypyruvate isomerase